LWLGAFLEHNQVTTQINNKTMNEVFLSYTWSKNRHNEINDFHERLQTDFQNKSGDTAATIFLDKQNLRGGDAFDDVIENELNDCKLRL
jgi:hypothetical protein